MLQGKSRKQILTTNQLIGQNVGLSCTLNEEGEFDSKREFQTPWPSPVEVKEKPGHEAWQNERISGRRENRCREGTAKDELENEISFIK